MMAFKPPRIQKIQEKGGGFKILDEKHHRSFRSSSHVRKILMKKIKADIREADRLYPERRKK